MAPSPHTFKHMNIVDEMDTPEMIALKSDNLVLFGKKPSEDPTGGDAA